MRGGETGETEERERERESLFRTYVPGNKMTTRDGGFRRKAVKKEIVFVLSTV